MMSFSTIIMQSISTSSFQYFVNHLEDYVVLLLLCCCCCCVGVSLNIFSNIYHFKRREQYATQVLQQKRTLLVKTQIKIMKVFFLSCIYDKDHMSALQIKNIFVIRNNEYFCFIFVMK